MGVPHAVTYRRTMTRRIAALAAGALTLLALVGCAPFIKSFAVSQPAGVAAPVQIDLEFCDDDSPDCGDAIGGPYQLTAAYAIPESAEVLSVKTSGTKAMTLVPSESYTEWLRANVEVPEGLEWVGFRSDLIGNVDGAPNLWTLTA